METENTHQDARHELRPCRTVPDLWLLSQGHRGRAVTLTTDQLRQIVQAAYDVAGIVATPSVALEAARGVEPAQSSCTGTEVCPAWEHHHFDCLAVV